MQRRWLPQVTPELVILAALTTAPLINLMVQGNMVAYSLLAMCVVWWRAESEHHEPKHLVTSFVAGFALAFKPMWLLPATYLLLLQRAWRVAAATALGAGVVVAVLVPRLARAPHRPRRPL